MTYGSGSDQPQRPQHFPPAGPQPPGWPPPPSGPQWTGPPPPRRPRRPRPPAPLILILVGVLLLGGAITAVVLVTRGGDPHTALVGPASSTAATPTADTGPQKTDSSGPTSGGSARPLPPATPTGKDYADEPPVGACVDVQLSARGGTVLYQAECGSPSAIMYLEKKQSQKCDEGYFDLKGFTGQILCFTYTVAVGECVDLDIPRRIACTPATGATNKVTITEIHPGAQDGSACPDPSSFLKVGQAADRGIACYTSVRAPGASAGSTPPIPSR